MKIIQLVVLAAIVSIFGCTHPMSPPSTGNPDQDALNSHRTLWKNANLSNYTYTYKRMCFCPPEEDITVTVQYGNVNAASYYPSNNPVLPERLDDLSTVEELFQLIQKAITSEVAQLDVTYNADLGYPEHIFIDVDKQMADEEMTHLVSNLHSNSLHSSNYGQKVHRMK
ncbi:Lipoprotein [Candidatus Electrothrix laxa]